MSLLFGQKANNNCYHVEYYYHSQYRVSEDRINTASNQSRRLVLSAVFIYFWHSSRSTVVLKSHQTLAFVLLLLRLKCAHRRKVQVGFSAKLQKSMKCVCMFLSASGDVEVGLQGPRKLWEPTRSASEKVRFSEITDGEYFFFFSHLPLTERHSVGLCSRRRSFFASPCPLLFFFVTILHGRLRDGPLGLWEPSPLLGSALVGANKMGPCLQICRYIEKEGGGVGWRGESHFVEVCWKLGCHLCIGSSYSRVNLGASVWLQSICWYRR